MSIANMPPPEPSPQGSSRVSLHDIAKSLGLHCSTVSRALNNNPSISPAVRKTVQEIAVAMGYIPEPMLSALAQYRNNKSLKNIVAEIAWINKWPRPKDLHSWQEFHLYWQGALHEAERCGYRLTEVIWESNMTASRLQHILMARNVAGILIPPHPQCPDWDCFDWSKFCVIRFGYSIHTPRAHLVTSDQMGAGLLAFLNLHKQGYERIGLTVSNSVRVRFLGGYALGQMQIEPKRRLPPLSLNGSHMAENQRQLVSWLKKTKPDAILTDIPHMRDMLEKIGCRVPANIGLAAMSVLDGNADAGIDQNSAEIGRAAVQLLISLIHHNERGIPETCRELLIEGRWVDGSTLPRRP